MKKRRDDPDQTDAEGRTPLHHAVARRDVAAVTALLLGGSDYERNDNAGYPPTHAMFNRR
jgi:ankyrin repeat protein